MEKIKSRRFDEGGDCGGRAMQWFWGRLSWENVKTKIKSMSLLINCFLLRRFTNYVDCWVYPPTTPACRSATPSTPDGGGV